MQVADAADATTRPRAFHILLVEDNPGDIRLTEEVLKNTELSCSVQTVQDGAEAIAYLRGEEPFTDRKLPNLVFLDLNLPKVSGTEVLAEIRRNPILKILPVVALSSSVNPDDVYNAYSLGANCFVQKPADLDQFFRFISMCYEFWCNIVTLPKSTHD